MPKKKDVSQEERPYYINEQGHLDFNKIFQLQPKQTELLRIVYRGGHPYVLPAASQCLSVGGIRSGKTVGVLMYMIQHYCLQYPGCDMLVLRRTFPELENGAIADFKAFMPKELYKYDTTKHIATLTNGSRIVFGHCEHNKEKDIQKYLGQAYPAILVDECGQFSPEAWTLLHTRNTANANCKPDIHDQMPMSVIWGCTNPLGPFYEFYRALFVQKKPFNMPEGAKEDKLDGTWWSPESGDWRLIYDPNDFAYQRSTVLDNPKLLERDPGIIDRLNKKSKAVREKMLLGLDGPTDGQYYDVFLEDAHVVNLREDPDAIIWQPWQPVWAGQDWGMGHWNATYFFTKALVRSHLNPDDYKLKVVCIGEIVLKGGKTYKELASMIAFKANRLPIKDANGNIAPTKVTHIFFSHEKFARVMDRHSPADDYSRELRALGMPSVSRGTQDRIGSASFLYNMLKNGDLVILDTCVEIIQAIPSLMRDPDMMDDVLKTESKGDDCYDGFRLGLYGMLGTRSRPHQEIVEEHAKTLDPVAAHFYRMKMEDELRRKNEVFVQEKRPVWEGRG